MLNRLLAFVLVSLCASPFTAPFRTWTPMHPHASLGAPAHAVADDDASSDTDPAALTVPPLDARAASPTAEAPLAAVVPSIQVFVEVGQSIESRANIPPGPAQSPSHRVIALRI